MTIFTSHQRLEHHRRKGATLRSLGHCVEEPQVLYNRKKPVAALIDMQEYEAFLEYKKSQRKPTMAELLAELDEIKKQEPGDFELPPRTSRPIPFLDEWSDE